MRSPLGNLTEHLETDRAVLEVLAVLSAAAAGGLRLALPLLLIGLLQGEQLWSQVPLLRHFSPYGVVGVLTAWSFLEIVLAGNIWGYRLIILVQLCFSPLVGALLGMTVATATDTPQWLIATLSGLFAFCVAVGAGRLVLSAGEATPLGDCRSGYSVYAVNLICSQGTQAGRVDCLTPIVVGRSQC